MGHISDQGCAGSSTTHGVDEAAKEEIREQDVTGRLREAAEKVGSATKEEVRERAGVEEAEVEEIDAEGRRRRAARAGEEMRDRVGGPE